MPSPTQILASDLATTRDVLKRAFDPARFLPRFDRIGRWVNANTGRKPKGQTPAKKPAARSLMQTAPATITAAAAETTPADNAKTDAAGAATVTPPAPAAPDFADIEAAAAGATLPTDPAAAPADPAPPAEAVTDTGTNSTAETVIGIIQTALVLIGDDEGVLSAQEKRMLRPPLERVLKKYDVGAEMLPAEVDLALAMATIIITRLHKPKTATFFAKLKMWFTGKVAASKGAKLAASVTAANAP